MQDNATTARNVYVPSGNLNWFRFLTGLLLSAATAGLMACCLFFAYQKGLYFMLIAPILASLPAIGVWYLALTQAHCRNKRIAGIASVALALLLYFGYYYLGLLQIVGLRHADRVDLLPQYIHLRIKTDVLREAHMPQAAQPKKPGVVDEVFNWFFFGSELIIVVALFAGTGVTRASRAYCECCGKWMERETLKLPSGQGAELWSALERGDAANVRRALANTSRKEAAAGSVTVECCPTCAAEGLPADVFFSVQDVPLPGARVPIRTRVAWLFKPRYAPKLRDIASHAALDPREVVLVAPAFSKLKALIAAQPASFPEIEVESPDAQDGGDGRSREWKGRLATVNAVEPADAGRVLTRTNALLQTAIGVILIFGGLGLAFVPSIVIAHLPGQQPDWLVGVGVVAMMLMIALNLVWLVGSYPMYFTMRFMLWQTRRAFDARLNPAVDLNDPELVFVDIVPPINRGKHMMENASDIGFLKIDKSRRELIFEGDRERYWIPAESILEVKHEYWADSVKHQLQSAPNLNHDILVRAMTANGPWETWLYRRHHRFRAKTAKRRLADALELQAMIAELVDVRKVVA